MRSQLETTPPYSGADMVADANEAFETIATSFAGSVDPAAMAWPYATWADTGNMLLKRRNAANTDWVSEGALLDFFYSRTSAVGTVSQSGGVPTGALIQQGSNANGQFWRFAGGMQICIAPFSVPPGGGSISFPAPFANTGYSLSASVAGTGQTSLAATKIADKTAATITIMVVLVSSGSSTVSSVAGAGDLVVVGPWH